MGFSVRTAEDGEGETPLLQLCRQLTKCALCALKPATRLPGVACHGPVQRVDLYDIYIYIYYFLYLPLFSLTTYGT